MSKYSRPKAQLLRVEPPRRRLTRIVLRGGSSMSDEFPGEGFYCRNDDENDSATRRFGTEESLTILQ